MEVFGRHRPGEELVVKSSDDEETAGYREINRWADEGSDITLADYLRDGLRF